MKEFASFGSCRRGGGEDGEVFDEKCLLPRTAMASNFTRDGQAGLGHPPWEGEGREHVRKKAVKGGF